ncbi:MAG: metallophosphoesterase, partial [Candidatus Binatia bacterium]
ANGSSRVVRLAAVGDLHCGRYPQAALHALLSHAGAEADALLLCGDLVDRGLPDEARLLARELASVTVPIVAVLGNHDVEAGQVSEVVAILADVGVRVLDGDSTTVLGVGVAGVKGFAGGFGAYALGAWGEPAIKAFVHEAVEEALKLEAALSRLHETPRIAILHYAPIAATVRGEPPELFPFLGSSRLEDPLNHYAVTAVFHGHAHHGAPDGRTSAGALVFNVSVPVLERTFPERPPYRVLEVEVPAPSDQVGAATGDGAPRGGVPEWIR